jgi:site-specific DNA-methyltransferase (adenine-specific)
MSVRLINGDCVEELKSIAESSIDLTVTSPPYDHLRSYNGNNDQWCEETWQRVFDGLFRVSKDGGVVVWIVNDATVNGSETGTSFKQALYAMKVGFKLHDTMIYMKDNPPPTGGSNRYFSSFEFMFVFSKGSPKRFNPIKMPRRNKWNDQRTCRVRPVTRNGKGEFHKKEVKVNTGTVKLQNVWSYIVSGGSIASDEFAHQHPAIFPEQLAKDHILSWSNECDTVFDPFMGSGTTGKMAVQLNRKFIGIELDQEYYSLAVKRLTVGTTSDQLN